MEFVVTASGRLWKPSRASVGGGDDDAEAALLPSTSHRPPTVGVDECDGVEVVVDARRLGVPCSAAVGRSEDRPAVHRPAMGMIGEGKRAAVVSALGIVRGPMRPSI